MVMEDREMKEYKDAFEILDAIAANEITDAEGAELVEKLNASAGRIGSWSGHDGLTQDLPVHPDADKEASDVVSGPSITAQKLAEEGRD